jgi:DNA-binding transcriptional ArsR family regulator
LWVFSALAQATRLQIVRMLVVAGPEGMAAGAIAEKSEVSASNVSFHLKELERAGLVAQERVSRSMIYRARYESLSELVQFLMQDCCAGHPAVCRPAAEFAACSSVMGEGKQ